MRRAPLLRRLFILILAAAVVAGGALGARMMTPDRAEAARAAFEQARGLVLVDICGEAERDGGPAHHCPFCHGLPKAPATPLPTREGRPIAHAALAPLVERAPTARGRDPSRSPRAPPARV